MITIEPAELARVLREHSGLTEEAAVALAVALGRTLGNTQASKADIDRVANQAFDALMKRPMRRIPDRLPADLVAEIDAWRAAQPAPPSKVQALIYLIRRGLAGDRAARDNGKLMGPRGERR